MRRAAQKIQIFFKAFHIRIYLFFRKAKDDYVRSYGLPSTLNQGNLSTRCWDFMDPLIKLQSQYNDLNREIVYIFKSLTLEIKTWIQENPSPGNDLTDPGKCYQGFPAIAKTLNNLRTKQIKRLNELVKRARTMRHRVVQASKLPDTPEAFRVPESEIDNSTRLYFIDGVEYILSHNATMMEMIMGCFEAAKEFCLKTKNN